MIVVVDGLDLLVDYLHGKYLKELDLILEKLFLCFQSINFWNYHLFGRKHSWCVWMNRRELKPIWTTVRTLININVSTVRCWSTSRTINCTWKSTSMTTRINWIHDIRWCSWFTIRQRCITVWNYSPFLQKTRNSRSKINERIFIPEILGRSCLRSWNKSSGI